MITHILPLRFVEALGFTLLHALWQGALFALALGLLLVALRRYSPQARYVVSIGMLGAFALSSALTFGRLYTAAPGELTTSSLYSDGSQSEITPTSADEDYDGFGYNLPTLQEQPEASAGAFERFGDYYDRHLPLLVTLWLLGVLVMQLRWLGQLAYVQRLKHYGNEVFPEAWRDQLSDLEAKLRIRKTVRYALSPRIDSPMVMGWLKPVILFPRAMFEQLGQTEIYAVLAHELAHVRREDFVVNLLQSLLTNVFFFHPGVWWMSSRADEEREQCCDDLAVAAIGAALPYAKTLISVSELSLKPAAAGTPRMAMAYKGPYNRKQRGGFAARLKRLFGQVGGANSFREGFATACILFGALGLTAFATSQTARSNGDTEAFMANTASRDLPLSYRIDTLVEPPAMSEYPEDFFSEADGDSRSSDPYDRIISSSLLDALNVAINKGNREIFAVLLAEVADVNGRDSEGYTPLGAAAHSDQVWAAKLLLAKGAKMESMSAEGWSALAEAADENSLGVAKLLIEAGANVNAISPRNRVSPLAIAAANGNLDMVKLLMRSGAEVNGFISHQETPAYPPLHAAASEGHTDVTMYLLNGGAKVDLQDSQGRSALMFAAAEGQGRDVALLMSRKANPNLKDRSGRRALDYAMEEDHGDIAKVLGLITEGPTGFNFHSDQPGSPAEERTHELAQKAQEQRQEALERRLDARVEAEMQALELQQMQQVLVELAPQDDQDELRKLLTFSGLNINLADVHGVTPLMLAAQAGQASNTRILLRSKAKPDVTDERGSTALHYAVKAAQIRSATAVLERKANVNAADRRGWTALHYASAAADKPMIELLLRYGANAEARTNRGQTPTAVAPR